MLNEDTILRYVAARPQGVLHKELVEILQGNNVDYARRVRNKIAFMSLAGLLKRSGRDARDWTYTAKAGVA